MTTQNTPDGVRDKSLKCVQLTATSWMPGSSARGLLQARILEWVAMPSSGDLPNPGPQPASLMSPALADSFFTPSANLMG